MTKSTDDLVDRFAAALKTKLTASEKKYAHRDGWEQDGWMEKCRDDLREHVEKGDPLDVAAYCAFLWHHGEATVTLPTHYTASTLVALSRELQSSVVSADPKRIAKARAALVSYMKGVLT